MRTAIPFALILLLARVAAAQSTPGSSTTNGFKEELHNEAQAIAAACSKGLRSFLDCPVDFAMDHPFHLTFASLASGNGVGFGPAFSTGLGTNDRHAISWNADTVRTGNGSWRAGGYLKLVWTNVKEPDVVPIDTSQPGAPPPLAIHTYPVIDFYGQSTHLSSLAFPDVPGASVEPTPFGLTETTAGVAAALPLLRVPSFHLSLRLEGNHRLIRVESAGGPAELFPGATNRVGYFQFGEGLRARPVSWGNRLQHDFQLKARQFASMSDAAPSFVEWTGDLEETFAFYRTVLSEEHKTGQGPDDCNEAGDSKPCPHVSVSHNRYGSIQFRLVLARQDASGDSSLPLYFQNTLGGTDINGERWLSAYSDYSFRGPRTAFWRLNAEHYLFGIVGLSAAIERGRATDPKTPGGPPEWHTSYAAGFSIRAGALPLAQVMWANGTDGHRIVALIDATLLGGSRRPSIH